MTEQHRAKPEQWAQVESWTHSPSPSFSCIIELRDRVEALEAAQRPNVRPELQNLPEGTRLLGYRVENSALPVEEWGEGHTIVDSAKPAESDNPEEPGSSLVEQVADGIAETFAPYVTADKPARAAIHTIADWLDQQELHVAATRLRQEVGE